MKLIKIERVDFKQGAALFPLHLKPEEGATITLAEHCGTTFVVHKSPCDGGYTVTRTPIHLVKRIVHYEMEV